MYIRWTYRPKRITNPFSLEANTSLNGVYTPSFFISNQFADYELAGLTKIEDQIIPEEKYTGEIAPWVKKLTRFIQWYYNEEYINWVDFANSVKAVWAEFQIEMFNTIEEAREWVRTNCNLLEIQEWVFLIQDEYVWIDWKIIPKTTIDII